MSHVEEEEEERVALTDLDLLDVEVGGGGVVVVSGGVVPAFDGAILFVGPFVRALVKGRIIGFSITVDARFFGELLDGTASPSEVTVVYVLKSSSPDTVNSFRRPFAKLLRLCFHNVAISGERDWSSSDDDDGGSILTGC